jgi:hypothetical protein
MIQNLEQFREQFNREAFSRIYVQTGALTLEETRKFITDTFKIQLMDLPGFRWFPTHHAIGVFGHIPLNLHFQALAAGVGQPFLGIEDLFRHLIQQGWLPNWILNRTHFFNPPTIRRRIGELMVQTGLINEATLLQCMGIQQQIHDQLAIKPRMASVIASMAMISLPDMIQLLGMQVNLPYDSLDDSAPAIFEAQRATIQSP